MKTAQYEGDHFAVNNLFVFIFISVYKNILNLGKICFLLLLIHQRKLDYVLRLA